MSLPTYGAIANQLAIPWCRGIQPNGQRCYERHRPGTVRDGQVHFADRRESRAGIRLFIFLAAKLVTQNTMEQESPGEPLDDWRVIYRANRTTANWIRWVTIEIPRSVTAPYKTQLKAMLAAVPPGDPEREEAWRWTNA